jgi:predicted adenylyl cyclase CyaB
MFRVPASSANKSIGVAGVDAIRRRFLKLGARIHASGFERNELFDCNDRLYGQGLKLRLRCHGGKIARLTVKGSRQNGRQKTRMEIETPVEYEAAKRILELLDFRVKETYSKVREEYRLDGCAVCLDHIPNAGWFVEIEGPLRKISQTARCLGLRAEFSPPRLPETPCVCWNSCSLKACCSTSTCVRGSTALMSLAARLKSVLEQK